MGRLAARLCALLLVVTLRRVAGQRDVTPRLTFAYDAEERRRSSFWAGGLFNLTSLLLSKEDGALYVGAREALFALDPADIGARERRRNLTWKTPDKKRSECTFKGKDLQTDCFNYVKILLRVNSTRLFVCGTNAFSPVCAYVDTANFSLVASGSGEVVTEDGRGRCPFDPEFRSTAVMADGELYAATVGNFQGNEPTISRSLGSGAALKTENSLNWLQDPTFVGSAYIRESLPRGDPVGDDDKIYFFFSEAAKELDLFDNTVVSRIARVCKGDVGGGRVLQKKWTTFLKAQLSCSPPDDGFPFNVIQDMFVLTPGPRAWKDSVFYGVFASQWSDGAAGASAVCSFTMRQVRRAFNGPYRELDRETRQWSAFERAVPEPRPGACITNAARERGVLSSLDMPDQALHFLKDHFLMDEVLRGQPLLLNRRARYTRVAVHQVAAAAAAPRRAYRVLFVGTDDGRLHKAVSVKQKMHVIEELLLFRHPQPVQHLQLDSEKGLLYASTFSELVSVPLANCTNYGSCGECILSRDPYCGWNGRRCVDVTRAQPNDFLQQDVDHADARAICNKTARARARPCRHIVIPANTLRVLPCEPRSKLAQRVWRSSETSGRSHYLGSGGGLAVVARAGGPVTYECWSLEEGFAQLLANYCVRGQAARQSAEREVRSPRLAAKTYWNELVVACGLLACSLLLFSLFVIYRHRRRNKGSERPGATQNGSRSAAQPAESSPPRRRPSPDDGESFSKSVGGPLQLRESRPEVSAAGPRPRVRLGSEIRDSLV